jgi:hypothetical protein
MHLVTKRTEKPDMPEWDSELKHFMTHWFSGLIEGLESVNQESRETILTECGKTCARSYTLQVFQDARQHSTDLDTFLGHLATRFPEAAYERLDAHTIHVTYIRCECDLVKCGLVSSPILCECSARNLQENFYHSLGTPVLVTIEASILGGDPQCVFLVTLED